MYFKDTLHYLNYKDSKLRKKFYINELNKVLLNNLIFDIRLKFLTRFLLKNKHFNIKKSYISILRSHCLMTGKPRFVFSFFRFNRSTLKFYSSYGFISGISKV